MSHWRSYWDETEWLRAEDAEKLVFDNCTIKDLVTQIIEQTKNIKLLPKRYTRIQINDILTLIELRDYLNKVITEKWITQVKILRILGE